MTYEERQQYRKLRERAVALGAALDEGARDEPVTRGEARELLALVDAALERMSPDRWDRAMEAIAGEAARRAGALGPQSQI